MKKMKSSFGIILLCILLCACSIPNDRVEVKNETTILTDAQANSIGNSIYDTIYKKYSGIAEITNPKVTLTDGEESDGGILRKIYGRRSQ